MVRREQAKEGPTGESQSLASFACPNPECGDFNRFSAGNLSVCERMGKHRAIRRLYCHTCGGRFSERQGSLLEYGKLPEAVVVRVIKCLGHGCSVEATADICEVDPRSVERVLLRAGKRGEHFHQLQLEKLRDPVEAVELDELHARVCPPAGKKGEVELAASLVRAVGAWARSGCTWLWRRSADS